MSFYKVCLYSSKKYFNKTRYLKQNSNLNVRELDSTTHSHQFDANCGKVQYVSEVAYGHSSLCTENLPDILIRQLHLLCFHK